VPSRRSRAKLGSSQLGEVVSSPTSASGARLRQDSLFGITARRLLTPVKWVKVTLLLTGARVLAGTGRGKHS
jgi:hypothetical protein